MIVELGIGATGGGIVGLLLLFILRSLRTDVVENRQNIQDVAAVGAKARKNLHKKMNGLEDNVNKQLLELVKSIHNMELKQNATLHYLEATSDMEKYPGAVQILKDARRKTT